MVPISIVIAVLLAIVATSYRQTIHAYPSGGGAYIVAKENLGITPGLVAGASLLVDYVLTVSVSIAAGVAAVTSMVQGTRYAWLDEHKVFMCMIFIALIPSSICAVSASQVRSLPHRLTLSLSVFCL